MEFNEYQALAQQTAIYPKGLGLYYTALGLAGEAGEVANKVKKLLRDGQLDKEALVSELGDVLWYLASLATELEVELDEVARKNLDKLMDRRNRQALGGAGDNR